MTIQELLQILENRLSYNASQRNGAAERGDVASVANYDADTATTQATIATLRAALLPA